MKGLENIRDSFHRILRPWGFDVVRYRPANDPDQRLVHLFGRYRVKTVLDVGANVGQFAKRMIAAGYPDRIISFEPVSSSHSMLLKNAEGYDQWQVARRCALGGERRKVMVNIAGNSESSSLLPMLERHVSALPISKYLGAEETELIRLDDVLEEFLPAEKGASLALKMDVQGFEGEVLDGAPRTLKQIKVIYTEMSLCPLYDREVPFFDLYSRILKLGFRCVGISPGFLDPTTWEVLQVDATFVAEQTNSK
ncbi:MAG: FkbM family methyltransferase [Candidatus Binatus sp.]